MKIRIQFRLFADLIKAAGGKEVVEEVEDGTTFKELIHQAAKKYGSAFLEILDGDNLNLNYLILKNGENLQSADVKLKNGDEVAIFPAICGG